MKRSLSAGERAVWIAIALIAVGNLAAFLCLLPTMPDQLPSHWGITGEIDKWSSKESQIVLAALPLAMFALFLVLPRIDPKGRNFDRFAGIYRTFTAALVIFMVGVTWMGPLTAWGLLSSEKSPVSAFVLGFLGLLLIGLGNYLPRVKPNYTFGIRTPWTIASEEVWRRTHRMSGPLFVVAGIATLVAAFVALTAPEVSFAIMLVAILGVTAIAGVYSYVIWKKLTPAE